MRTGTYPKKSGLLQGRTWMRIQTKKKRVPPHQRMIPRSQRKVVTGGRKEARRSEPIRSHILFAGAGEEVGTDIIAGPVGRTPTG